MNLITHLDCPNYANRGTIISAHIADIHFGAMNPETQYKILEEQFINKIISLPLDIVSIDGDLFDHKAMANSDLIMYGIKFVDTLIQKVIIPKKCTLIIILGTNGHDNDQLKLFYHYISNPNIDIRIVEQPRFEYVKGAKILCLPEVPSVPDEMYNELLHNSGLYDEAYMHGTLDSAGFEASTNCKKFTISDFSNCIGPIISGHIHDGGCFNKYFYYCGSPYSWSFKDKDYKKGFYLCLHNLDTGYHYIYKELIKSFRYETINFDDMLNADPNQIVAYVDKIKQEKGIDFLRVEFNKEVSTDLKYILESYFKSNSTVKLKYNFTKENKFIQNQEKDNAIMEQYGYLFDNSLSDYDKLARYINDDIGSIYISGEDIKKLVEEEL